MKKLLFTATLFLMFSMNVYAEYKKEDLDKMYADRTKIIKANNLVGYKGKTKIKVSHYHAGYAYHPNAEAGDDNIGKTYDTYIDSSNEDNISVIISKSKHNKELKINIKPNEMILTYEGKTILVNDNKTAEQAAKEIPLYKYPKSIVVNLYSHFIYFEYYKNLGYDDRKATDIITGILDMKSVAEYYVNEIEKRITEKNYEIDDEGYNIYLNNKYEITAIQMGEDSFDGYAWKNNSLATISINNIGEAIDIEFLDPKGWIRK